MQAQAGIDLVGVVTQIQIKPGSGQLWFKINNPYISTYCQSGWAGLHMYVPTSDPDYPYYYGLLVASLTKNIPVYIGNISTYSNSPVCDITQTSYGLMLLNQ